MIHIYMSFQHDGFQQCFGVKIKKSAFETTSILRNYCIEGFDPMGFLHCLKTNVSYIATSITYKTNLLKTLNMNIKLRH